MVLFRKNKIILWLLGAFLLGAVAGSGIVLVRNQPLISSARIGSPASCGFLSAWLMEIMDIYGNAYNPANQPLVDHLRSLFNRECRSLALK